jgi:hypothetical protein
MGFVPLCDRRPGDVGKKASKVSEKKEDLG